MLQAQLLLESSTPEFHFRMTYGTAKRKRKVDGMDSLNWVNKFTSRYYN